MSNEPIDLNQRERNRRAGRILKIVLLSAGCALAALVLLFNSIYVIGENEQAVLSRFGVIEEVVLTPSNDFMELYPGLMNAEGTRLQDVKVVKDKGLRFKLPFVTQVQIYDGRLNTFTSNAEPVNTSDKKQYYVTIFGQWQIANPALFSITQQNMVKAEQYLDNLVFPVIVQNINNLSAEDFVNNKDVLNQVLDEALATINDTVKESGIRFKDIQVNRTLLPDANMQSTYERMIANRPRWPSSCAPRAKRNTTRPWPPPTATPGSSPPTPSATPSASRARATPRRWPSTPRPTAWTRSFTPTGAPCRRWKRP